MNIPKLRFQEFQGEWEKKKLGDIVSLMQSGLSRKLEEKDIGVPVLRSNNLLNNKLDLSDISYWFKVDDKGANIDNYLLKKGDLLVNFINSLKQIGKTAIYNGELKRDSIFTTNIMRLRFYNSINPGYIHNYFQTKKYKDYIKSITKPAVNQASFTTVDFKRLNLTIPSLSEQEKIVSFLSKVDEKIEKIEKKQLLWNIFKKVIMKKLFVQELRFKDVNHEYYPNW
jgi:type I restriction enzyme S subunit